ncbi:GMC oxidoreductase [Nocardioides insulae]|uniref:GMC oxidoreductase n=1 Tax=Nocardioides insulae TaxID=394734 RepID=UPI00041FB3C5|nr:GMC oxidoreductase [Nocardioides insulae]
MTRNYPYSVDVAIVGSGPTGAAYARILSELSPEATIATFEVGPQLTATPGMHVKNISDLAERAVAQRRSEGPAASGQISTGGPVDTMDGYADAAPRLVRPGTFLLPDGYRQEGEDGLPAAAMSSNVGGMGAHWTGACPRPGGQERVAFLDDLDELLDEAERLLSVDAHAFDDAPFSAEVRKRLADAVDDGRAEDRRVASMPLAVVRHDDGSLTWSGSDAVFGDSTRANPNFELFDESLVARVLTDAGTGAARGVRVRDLQTGEEHEVAARFVVVAGDSLRTPQLLWASNVRPRALGRYLNDQPQTVYAVRLRDVEPDEVADDIPEAAEITKQSGVNWVPFTDDEPFHGQVMQLDASPVPLAGDEPGRGTIVGLGWFCAKDLQESDRVEFDDDAVDPYGMPKMRIHYTLSEADHRSLEASRASILRAAAALGEPLDDSAPLTFPPGASLHYQGSVRMGAVDDGTSVCGPTSEVWAAPGLFVAGNGVIPTSIACNPTLLAVALAVGGARDIASRLTARSGEERN